MGDCETSQNTQHGKTLQGVARFRRRNCCQ
jgi:hypothetical protein